MTIRNPLEWGADQLRLGSQSVAHGASAVYRPEEHVPGAIPVVRRIRIADLRDVLTKGFEDFGAYRTDVIFLCLIYPVVGLVLARALVVEDMLPLLFPLASGFALIGPLAGLGLYEMSRQHEQGGMVSWAAAFGVLRAPRLGSILVLGVVLVVLFGLWVVAAQTIYNLTLGPEAPASIGAFVDDLVSTGPGWAMIVVGCGVGFVFAVVVMTISVVSLPMLLDRNVGVDTAVKTSVRAVLANPGPMAVWGLIVASGLILGSIPLFIGLAIVLPVLGHATWHLYRKLVP